MQKEEISSWFQQLQDNICRQIEQTDSKARFEEDLWTREAGGGGRTRIIQKGNILEKGGVLFSAVHGDTPANILRALHLEEAEFYATGVSIVMHPQNPMVPIIHMNVRYFEMSNGISWFGGGIDLTPHYVEEADARFFMENSNKPAIHTIVHITRHSNNGPTIISTLNTGRKPGVLAASSSTVCQLPGSLV